MTGLHDEDASDPSARDASDAVRVSPRPFGLVPVALFAAIASASVGYVALGAYGPRPQSSMSLSWHRATIAGVEVVDASPATFDAIRGALRKLLDGPVQLTGKNDGKGEAVLIHRSVSRTSLGGRIDEARLRELVTIALDRNAPTPTPKGSHVLPLPIAVDARASFAAAIALKEDLDRPASDARIDLDARKVVAEAAGLRVDAYATLAAIDLALRNGAVSIAIASVEVAPKVAKEALGEVAMNDAIGFFETKYAVDQKHVDRTFNLRLAASKLNGKVLMPGETFDFNEVVGPRDETHGYRVAKVIADGELVDGMGGGTCQVAGTLHGAAFFAGLEIVQRTPHTRPSYYIKMGLDAAVAYPTIDLKIRNPFDVPVVLRETVSGGTVRAEILGPKRLRTVTFVRTIDEVIPYPSRQVPDERYARGSKVMSQRGIPGFKVRRYRIVRDGSNAVREASTDSYPPTSEIWRVGTGGAGTPRAPVGDDHPEYVADEVLTITQGAAPAVGTRVGADGMEESRVAGRTGVHGWSHRYAEHAAHSGDSGDTPDDAAAKSEPDDADTVAPVKKSRPRNRHK